MDIDRSIQNAASAGPARSLLYRAARLVPARLLETYVVFAFFALLLLLFTWLSVAYVIGVEYRETMRAAVDSSREIADTYEAQAVRNLVFIDQTLKTVAFAYVAKGGLALEALQGKNLLPPAIVFRVAIFDSHGLVTASTRRDSPASVSDQTFFTAQFASDGDALFVGPVMRDAVSGAPEITFSRRLVDGAGRFAGVATLAVDPSYFTSGYDVARLGKMGFVGLLGTDGVMRAQQVGDHVSWGASVPVPRADRMPDAPQVHPWDSGVARFSNVRPLHGFPLMVIAGLSADEALSRYRSDRLFYMLATAAGSVLLLVLTAILSLKSRELVLSRARARRVQQTFYAASEGSLDAFFVWECVHSVGNRHSAIVGFLLRDISRRGAELVGKPREALIGGSLDRVFPDTDYYSTMREFVRVFESGVVEEREWLHWPAEGAAVWLHRQVVRVDDGVVAIVRDITARKRAEVQRVEQNRILEMIAARQPLDEVLKSLMNLLESQFADCAWAVLLRDNDGLHVRVGAAPSLPAAFRQTVHGTVIGPDMPPYGLAIFTRQPVSASQAPADESYAAAMAAAGMLEFRTCRSVPILSDSGDTLGALTIFMRESREIDAIEAQMIAMATRIAGIAIERMRAEERIRHMATHDALTGLPNRTLLGDRLSLMLRHARRYRHAVIVVFVDLDNFKLINDSLGHRAGDELLKTVATRMRSCVRHTDTVVRLGGDEFVLVLVDESLEGGEARMVVERLREAVLEPVELAGQEYQVSCSMGLARYPADGEDAETLLMNADAAMYRAKELGRNNCQSYTSEMNAKVRDRLRRQKQLGEALANGEFRVVYQPQVDTRSDTILGVEALLRWDHPVDGPIPPMTFIPLAEETGLIVPIGEWVLRTACFQGKAWQDAGLPAVTMSVNVSARQFLHDEWVSTVARALSDSGLEARHLELELTESLIMQDLDGCIETMKKLKEMGVQLSIDDFGTGYSSLSALKHLPIVRLKIDKSFVRELPQGEDDRAIVMAVISMSRRLNLNVIAEGVETQEQVDFLRESDCHEIQGYYFSRPVAPGDIEVMLRERGEVGALRAV
ncbi:EAL domain-containing protein [Trinickia terrae]|uniref:EAL domain-containing protein n=1 Tax=Trinickia terrae TaxID=2571161 RepID=A0A4V5PIJ8_9BURK|nr:EAL domain-containing protein [Trinickia terrae]TKC87660.1 EAL domain-containing protein [Trinickia terrae]